MNGAERGGGVAARAFNTLVAFGKIVLAFRCVTIAHSVMSELLYTICYTSAVANESVRELKQGVQVGSGVAAMHMCSPRCSSCPTL